MVIVLPEIKFWKCKKSCKLFFGKLALCQKEDSRKLKSGCFNFRQLGTVFFDFLLISGRWNTFCHSWHGACAKFFSPVLPCCAKKSWHGFLQKNCIFSKIMCDYSLFSGKKYFPLEFLTYIVYNREECDIEKLVKSEQLTCPIYKLSFLLLNYCKNRGDLWLWLLGTLER